MELVAPAADKGVPKDLVVERKASAVADSEGTRDLVATAVERVVLLEAIAVELPVATVVADVSHLRSHSALDLKL